MFLCGLYDYVKNAYVDYMRCSHDGLNFLKDLSHSYLQMMNYIAYAYFYNDFILMMK